MALTLLQAPQGLVVSYEEAKLYLHLDADFEQELVEHMSRAAAQAVEAYTGRALLNQRWRYQMNAGFMVERSSSSYLQGETTRGRGGVLLPKSPFQELLGSPMLVKEDGAQVPLRRYRLDQAQREARLHVELDANTSPQDTMRVDFLAGYGPTGDHIPPPIKQAILLMLVHLHDHRGESIRDLGPIRNDNRCGVGTHLSPDVVALLQPFKVMRL